MSLFGPAAVEAAAKVAFLREYFTDAPDGAAEAAWREMPAETRAVWVRESAEEFAAAEATLDREMLSKRVMETWIDPGRVVRRRRGERFPDHLGRAVIAALFPEGEADR
jgi:hypothetical protein